MSWKCGATVIRPRSRRAIRRADVHRETHRHPRSLSRSTICPYTNSGVTPATRHESHSGAPSQCAPSTSRSAASAPGTVSPRALSTMTAIQLPDYYEVLQVSPRADRETIERVFRHLAKRYHPDNRDSGNTEIFNQVANAYRVLTDPEQRARYDIAYEQAKAMQWRIFDQETTHSEIAADLRIRN